MILGLPPSAVLLHLVKQQQDSIVHHQQDALTAHQQQAMQHSAAPQCSSSWHRAVYKRCMRQLQIEVRRLGCASLT